jgi:hypothetical protein
MSISEVTPLRSTIAAWLIELLFGVQSEGPSLETVANPLTAVSE